MLTTVIIASLWIIGSTALIIGLCRAGRSDRE